MQELCPRCNKNHYLADYASGQRSEGDPPPPALSRSDNQTRICSDCGTEEALLDFQGQKLAGPADWPLVKN